MKKRLLIFLSRYRAPCLCLLSGLLLSLFAAQHEGRLFSPDTAPTLPRGNYGAEDARYALVVEGLSDEETELLLPVRARRYREEELAIAAEACMEKLPLTVLNGNASLSEIRTKLSLPHFFPEEGLSASYLSSNPTLLDSYGNVNNGKLTDAVDVTLSVRLRDSPDREGLLFVLPLTILPPARSAEEALRQDFLSYLEEEDGRQLHSASLSLPTAYRGRKLRYREKKKQESRLFFLLGAVAALLFLLKERQDRADKAAARREQLLLDYPELVSKLLVLLGAGMNARAALLSIASDYTEEQAKRKSPRAAYEELTKALLLLRAGESESHMYRAFGRACGLRQYMKLASLLEQNQRTGVAALRNILSAEMSIAWEERKNLARRLGEEAGTKLLLPLFLMLLVVMVIMVVPALFSF